MYSVSAGGLYYGGICDNANCRAYNQRILQNRGYDEKIDPFDEVVEETIKCPGCSTVFQLKEFILYRCNCRIVFKKQGMNTKTANHTAKNNEFVRLGVNEAGDTVNANYQYLKFYVYRRG